MRGRLVAMLIVSAVMPACGGGAAENGRPRAGGFPPMPVKTVTLAPKAIAQTSEFVAALRSLRSTTIQPQVEGFVTRIFVRSGDRVRPGQPIAQIDPDKQQAAVSSLESTRAARDADLALARQQLDRMRTLLEVGAVSRQELEQAEAAYKSAEAQLGALDAQIREHRVELQYYRITAPTAGVIGDIPIRVGDRVDKSTEITTIDESQGLEVYIWVPLEQASSLKLGLPVELLDDEGASIAKNEVTFIAPRADDATQSVLVKSLLRDVPRPMRVLQYVRARIVWSTEPGLAVPIVAVSRVGGGHFCFVVEPQENGFVARQKPVQVGEVLGEEYVIRSGLKPGDRLIVSGVQKLGDGMPVEPQV